VVRLATQDDAADVARLMIGFRDWQGRSEPDNASIAATVERLLADPNTEFLLGGGPPVGVCQLRYRLSVWTGTDDCCLEDLFVEADVRGSGLGRELVDAALERARERGCTRMVLDANEANAPAQALYRSVGFDSWSAAAGGNDLFMRLRL
jgi:ribosomal protein S18 acetylase RimI-like enzyme